MAFGIAAMLAFAVGGCSRASGTHEGTVFFDDGTPVRSGSVEFRSLADGSRYASRIAADGSFALADQDGEVGCPPGEYEVVVVQIVLAEDLAAEAHEHGRTVPRRYADYYTSGLRITTLEQSDSPVLIKLDTNSR